MGKVSGEAMDDIRALNRVVGDRNRGHDDLLEAATAVLSHFEEELSHGTGPAPDETCGHWWEDDDGTHYCDLPTGHEGRRHVCACAVAEKERDDGPLFAHVDTGSDVVPPAPGVCSGCGGPLEPGAHGRCANCEDRGEGAGS